MTMKLATLKRTIATDIRQARNAANYAALTPSERRALAKQHAYYCQLHAEARRMVRSGKYGRGKYTGEKVSA